MSIQIVTQALVNPKGFCSIRKLMPTQDGTSQADKDAASDMGEDLVLVVGKAVQIHPFSNAERVRR